MLQGFGLPDSRKRIPLNLPDQPDDPLDHLLILFLPVQIILPPGEGYEAPHEYIGERVVLESRDRKKTHSTGVKKARETGMKKVEIGTGQGLSDFTAETP